VLQWTQEDGMFKDGKNKEGISKKQELLPYVGNGARTVSRIVTSRARHED
jgi:hypothetical protein